VCFDKDVNGLSPSSCFQALEIASFSNPISPRHESFPLPVLQILQEPETHLQLATLPRKLRTPVPEGHAFERNAKNPALLKTPVFEVIFVLSRNGYQGRTFSTASSRSGPRMRTYFVLKLRCKLSTCLALISILSG